MRNKANIDFSSSNVKQCNIPHRASAVFQWQDAVLMIHHVWVGPRGHHRKYVAVEKKKKCSRHEVLMTLVRGAPVSRAVLRRAIRRPLITVG